MSTINQPKTMLECIELYREAGNEMSVPREVMAAWLIREGVWSPTFESQLRECSRQLGDSLGKAMDISPSGKKHKKYVAARLPWPDDEGKITQKWLWDELMACDNRHFHNAKTHLYNGIGKDCILLNSTIEAAMEGNPNLAGETINVSWDFTDVVNEAKK